MSEMTNAGPPLPPDNPARTMVSVRPEDESTQHIGLVEDTYTITVAGNDTEDRFCVIDMRVPPGGGPPPHRHDFEETFILLEGEMQMIFRGETSAVRAGDTVHLPSNAPNQFHNSSSQPIRMICICSPAGNDQFFHEVWSACGDPHNSTPKLDKQEMIAFIENVKTLAPKYRTKLLDKEYSLGLSPRLYSPDYCVVVGMLIKGRSRRHSAGACTICVRQTKHQCGVRPNHVSRPTKTGNVIWRFGALR